MAPNSLLGLVAYRVVAELPFLHDKVLAPFMVNSDISQDPAKPGETAQIPFFGEKSVGSRTASNVFTAPSASTVTSKNFTYDYNPFVDFALEDTEAVKLNHGGFKQKEIQGCLIALANEINKDVWATAEGVFYQAYGTAGTAPFGTGVGILSAAKAASLLDDEGAPDSNRYGVINGAALENARILDNFVHANLAGSDQTLRKGKLGEVYNIMWDSDNKGLFYHTAGTLSDGVSMKGTLDGNHALGATEITIDSSTLTGTVKKGDIFTKAGDAQTYVVTADATAAGNEITFTCSPGFRIAALDGVLCTFIGSYQANLVFERDAIACKHAPLSWEMGTDPNIANIRDPYTGWTFRLERQRQEGQTRWIIDVLYAAKALDGRRGMILLG